jgi:hypothetical protein
LTLYYIRNWTIWVDLQILFRTASRVLKWEGRSEHVTSRTTIAGAGGAGRVSGSGGDLLPFATGEAPGSSEAGSNAYAVENPASWTEEEDLFAGPGRMDRTRE